MTHTSARRIPCAIRVRLLHHDIMPEKTVCAWAQSHELNRKYHDTEWGTPLHDDRLLFEFLMLEGAQAGLSWLTILKKRENYRRAFDGFDVAKIARYPEKKLAA